MQERESAVEARLVQGVRRLGGVAFKFISPGHTGVPDRMVVMPGGVVVFTEVKTTQGRLSQRQKLTIKQMRELGLDVRVLFGMDAVEIFLMWLESQVRLEGLNGKNGGVR